MIRDIFVLGASLALGAAAAVAAGGLPGPTAAVQAIEVRARALPLGIQAPSAGPPDRLRFLGALELSSPTREFGGISGLAWAPGCERLLAVSDTGNWLVMEPVTQGGFLSGLRAAWMAPLLDRNGASGAGKRANDAESLALDGATAFVGYEQTHRVRRYEGIDPCAPATLARPAAAEAPIPRSAGWRANGGAEALALTPGGLLAIAEGVSGGHIGDMRDGRTWAWGTPGTDFRWRAPKGYNPTDAATADGALFVLHRRFSPTEGVGAVLTVAPLASAGEAPAEELLRLAPPRTVDNMEGLAVERSGGRTFVWLVSDDNFNPVQRTILMRFELMPAAPSPRNAARRSEPGIPSAR